MLKLVKKSIKWIIRVVILIVFNKSVKYLFTRINAVCKLMYSYSIGNDFKHIAEGYLFEYPVLMKGGKYIEIGKNFSTRARFRIEAWDYYNGIHFKPQIIIGDHVIFNFDCHLGSINKIQIGNNVLIGSRVLITDHNHGEITKEELGTAPFLRPLYSKGPVIIGDNVWIGEGVAILPNVTIGKNAIIGANSVVTINIPDNCVAGGIPARVIKQF